MVISKIFDIENATPKRITKYPFFGFGYFDIHQQTRRAAERRL
jgi:hypothetical protein